jgi:hypothetical protein
MLPTHPKRKLAGVREREETPRSLRKAPVLSIRNFTVNGKPQQGRPHVVSRREVLQASQ